MIAAAGTEIISDKVRDDLVSFVKQGGTVLFTGSAGVYDEHYRSRNQQVETIKDIKDFENAQKPLNAFHELLGPDPLGSKKDVITADCGKGRAAWIREMDVDRVARIPDNWSHSPQNLMMPRNAHQIDSVFSYLVPEGFEIGVDTLGKIYVHCAKRPDTGELLVHLINHEFETKNPMAVLYLHLAKEPKEIVSISMNDEEEDYPERAEKFSMDGSTVKITVNDIKVHRTVIVRF